MEVSVIFLIFFFLETLKIIACMCGTDDKLMNESLKAVLLCSLFTFGTDAACIVKYIT